MEYQVQSTLSASGGIVIQNIFDFSYRVVLSIMGMPVIVFPTIRDFLYCSAGHACFTLGLIGVPVPVLPTVPLMLAACYFYERGSPYFHVLLLENRFFGPDIKEYEKSGAIQSRAKIKAIITITLGISWSAYSAPLMWAKIVMILIGILVSFFILTRPSN